MGRPLLYILLAILAGLAVYSFTKSKPSGSGGTSEDRQFENDEDEGLTPPDPKIEATKKILADRELPGEEPAVPPVLNCVLSFEKVGGKTWLHFSITEEHDYYVETFTIRMWKKGHEATPFSLWFDKYLPAKDTLVLTSPITQWELDMHAGGELGTPEDWVVEIKGNRARVQNPDPLPSQSG